LRIAKDAPEWLADSRGRNLSRYVKRSEAMDDKDRQSALMSAVTTEHFVLQTAANTSVSEAGARASLYLLTLSSSLVAMGFAAGAREVFVPFVATVVPAVFLLGLFTVGRLVDANLEYQQFLTGIARIREYYRALTPEAVELFPTAAGRWPEAPYSPALRLGTFVGFITTSASMVAFVNSIVAGAGVSLLIGELLGTNRLGLALALGVLAASAVMGAFLLYQRWRFATG
jgi:hypothetical protein